MKYYLISDDELPMTGFRLAGVEGEFVTDGASARAAAEKAEADESIAVLLVTTGAVALMPETVERMKLSELRPLLTIVPSPDGKGMGPDAITGLIRQAIGVKL